MLILKLIHFLTVIITVTVVFCAPFNLSAMPTSFNEAKKIARNEIYFDQSAGNQGTLYCGCQWQWMGKSGGRVDLSSCGYQVRKQINRAQRIEWEHIVPAWVFGHQRQCWQNGGRKNCVMTDPVFRAIEADLYNIAPSIGEVNGDRSNFNYGQLASSVLSPYGQCQSRVDFKNRIFEPRNEVKGQVARVMFYMYDRYNLTMSKQQQQLLMAWDRQFPVNRWEKLQNERIGKITGHYNPFVTGELTWQLGHRNQAAGLSVATAEIEKKVIKTKSNISDMANNYLTAVIKGNQISQIYHFSHCQGYKVLSAKNSIVFENEQAAIAAGYRLAKNCPRQ